MKCCDEMRKALEKCAAHAGHPDAAEGCRLVIAVVKQSLASHSPAEPIEDREKESIIRVVCAHMEWLKLKGERWYQLPNPMFGGCSPEDLVNKGRAHKVWSFIAAAIEESKTPKPSEPQANNEIASNCEQGEPLITSRGQCEHPSTHYPSGAPGWMCAVCGVCVKPLPQGPKQS